MLNLLKAWMMKCMGLPSCQEIEQFAYAYLEEELELGLVRKFERHIRGCKNCERFIMSYRQVARPDDLLTKTPLDPNFERRVARFLRERQN